MTPTEIANVFRAAAEDTAEWLNLDEVTVHAYSGRGMYGRQCLAVTLPDHAIPMFAASLVVAARAHYDDDGSDVRDFLAGDVRTDSMGRETVLYFPRLDYDEDEQGSSAAQYWFAPRTDSELADS